MKKTISSLLLLICAALPAAAMTWSVNPSNSNQYLDDTGSWTLTLGNFNANYDGVQYSGKEITGVAYAENGANGVIDLTTFESDTGLTLRGIGNNKFGNSTASYALTSLKEAYFPDTIVYIGQNLFRNCTGLEKVKVPTSVCRIAGDSHFRMCMSLTTVYYTGFEPVEGTVALPPCFTALTEFMFESVPMTRFYGPGVIHVERSCFAGCSSLVSAEFSPNATAFMDNGWTQGIFHNDQTYLSKLVNVYPSTFCADFVMQGTSYSIPFNNVTRTFKGTGWLCNAAITNYFDLSATSIPLVNEFACYNTCIAGATFPATLTEIGNRAFNGIKNAATFRFLGPPPVFKNNNNGSQSVFYQSQQNQVGYRHTLIVDAETYPAWTNAAKFVAVKDFATNSVVNNAYSTSSADFPTPKHPEETLGVTTWGFEGNSGNGARYAWLVQYVDHSTVAATWMNGDTAFCEATSVPVGTAPTAPDGTPAKASTAEFDYTFVGWNTAPDATTALDLSTLALEDDTTFYAIYAAATRSYTITWMLDADTRIDTTTVLYGSAPTHADASKPSTAEYSYEFLGWSTDGATVLSSIPAVTGPATYVAVFQQHDATTTATISWFDEDGTTALDPAQTTVTKGERPAHAEPTKAPTVDTVFTFAGWVEVGSDGSVTNTTASLPAVTADIAYKAAYTASVRRYTVTFANWDGTVVDATDYDYGTAANDVAIPADPTRPATAEYTYTFAGWDAPVTNVVGAATYTATYTETANEYAATFVDGVDGSTILGPTNYAYGAAVTAPEPPEHYGFTFSAWSPAVSTMPAAATTYTAVYTTNKFTITWVNGDATTTAKYDYLTPTAAITVPTGSKSASSKASYVFLEWSPALEPVQSNTTYTAMFQGTVLSPMTLLYGGTTIGEDAASAAVSATMSNYTAGEEGFSADVTAAVRNHTQVFDSATGTAAFEAPAVTATFTALSAAKGYDWTIVATQWLATANVADVATLHGRFYAKPTKTWFTPEQAVFEDGVFKPVVPSGSSQQVRIRATMTFPAVPSRAPADATGAVTGIDVFQANAGKPRAYYAWNGAQWVQLHGAVARLGEPVELLGVIDFAIKGGTMTWYADGAQLTDADGNWAIPMSLGPKQISRFVFDSAAATLDSLDGDYDLGFNGTLLLLN